MKRKPILLLMCAFLVLQCGCNKTDNNNLSETESIQASEEKDVTSNSKIDEIFDIVENFYVVDKAEILLFGSKDNKCVLARYNMDTSEIDYVSGINFLVNNISKQNNNAA